MVSFKQPKLGLRQELSFSKISEFTTGYTFTPCVGSFTSPGIDTRQKGPPAFLVSCLFRKTQANVGWMKLPTFRNSGRWIEPPTPLLTTWHSTMRPPLPIRQWNCITMWRHISANGHIMCSNKGERHTGREKWEGREGERVWMSVIVVCMGVYVLYILLPLICMPVSCFLPIYWK